MNCPFMLDLFLCFKAHSCSKHCLGLAPGAHFTSISAHDSQCPEKGKLFEIPITVIRTEQLSTGLKPGVSHQVRFKYHSISIFGCELQPIEPLCKSVCLQVCMSAHIYYIYTYAYICILSYLE